VRRFFVYALPPLLYAGFIFYLSAQSALPSPGIEGFDKVEHLAAYALLGALIARGFYGYGVARQKALLLGVLFGTLYGISDEYHQSFVPGRTADWKDAVADLLGSSFGAGAWSMIVAVRPRESSR